MIVYPTTDYVSWISEADADAYFATRLNADEFTAATSAIKEAALQTAFRSLAELNLDILFNDDKTLADTYTATETAAILKALTEAQCEQALHELKHDLSELQASSVSLGGMLSVKLAQGEKPARYNERALAILRPYLKARSISRYR